MLWSPASAGTCAADPVVAACSKTFVLHSQRDDPLIYRLYRDNIGKFQFPDAVPVSGDASWARFCMPVCTPGTSIAQLLDLALPVCCSLPVISELFRDFGHSAIRAKPRRQLHPHVRLWGSDLSVFTAMSIEVAVRTINVIHDGCLQVRIQTSIDGTPCLL
jgi:hypothetical protein